MKNRIKISYFSHAFMMLAFMGAVTACVNEDEFCTDNNSIKQTTKEGLAVLPTVSESSLIVANTRAEEDPYQEKTLNTLDVFVEGVTTTTFWKQYHLPYSDGESVQEQVQNFLANSWRKEGLKEGEKYNIYVAANNPLTTENIANVSALKGLTYSEVEEGIAVVDAATNNISWPWTDQFAHTPSGFIYKQYVAESEASAVAVDGDLYGFTTEKEFMMDGVIKDWTPNPNSQSQEFDVTMNRAAAKIVLNVKFDADFLKSLTHEKKTVEGVETWVEKPVAEQVTITGSPAWRFYNFAFGAPVFTPDTTTPAAGVEVHSSATLLRHPYEYSDDNKSFQIITYSYPNVWLEKDYATKAPSLVISVGYLDNGATEPNYHYYRIPLVKSTVTELERNHIYVINATIATRGSDTHEDITPMENLYYEVLPWNDENNTAAIHDEVESVQQYYFKVNPKVYTLRGDGNQSVDLNYIKAVGTKVNWKLFTYDANGNQTGVVEKDAGTRAWFYDANGKFTSTYDDSSSTDWSNMGVDIVQSTEGTTGSSGKITVTSTALTNKGIKYIRLRVYLDEVVDNVSLEEEYHQDIIIRHFPTDNIQNIAGHWSSYHPTGSSTEMVTLTTRTLSEAESWAEQYGVQYTTSEVPLTEYINYATYSANSSDTEHYHMSGPTATNYNTFHNMVQNATNRMNANSQATAVADGGEGHTYYWGTDATVVYTGRDYYGQYDWTTGNGRNTQWHKYSNYYYATYTHTYTYTQYSVTVPMSSTGNWVDWDDRSSHTSARTYQINYGTQDWYGNYEGTFLAKVYNNGIYRITESGSNQAGWTTTTGTQETGLNNNHMYVIQISSTSDSYVLGRPYVNQTTHQSNDNVVSPAFMIASQLGAVLPFTGNNGPTNAATHCSQYMEVSSDGMRYTGWRLPTEAEISVITGYQYGEIEGIEIPDDYQVITPVLTGQWYHSLSGREVEANPDAGSGSTTRSYLRCVRDLSAEEVDRLNGFDKIIEKYQ